MSTKILCALLFLLATGCVRTSTVSFVDPEYQSVRFNRLLVVADLALDHRAPAEDAAIATCASQKIICFRGLDYIPPTRKFSGQILSEALRKTNADAILFLGITDAGTTESYVPPTYHPGQTTSTVNLLGNTAYVNSYTSPGYTTGGYSISKPRAKYSAVLLDPKGGNTVWTATFNSRGSAFVGHIDLSKDAATEAIKKLVMDNVL